MQTSPRTEIFFTADCLIVGDWKLLTGAVPSASWGGPTYPNKTSANNYLAMYLHLTEDSAEPNLRCRHGNAEDARTALCTQRRVGLTGSLHTTSRCADRL